MWLVDPYNDFLSDGGKLWPLVKDVAQDVGLLANTCIGPTGSFAMELGYHVTLIRDATAAFSADRMHAAHVLNGPNFAHAILTTSELLAALPGTERRRTT